MALSWYLTDLCEEEVYPESIGSCGTPCQRSRAVLTIIEECYILGKDGPVFGHIRSWCLRIAFTSYISSISTNRVWKNGLVSRIHIILYKEMSLAISIIVL